MLGSSREDDIGEALYAVLVVDIDGVQVFSIGNSFLIFLEKRKNI